MNPLLALALAYGVSSALLERLKETPGDAELIQEIERELDRLGYSLSVRIPQPPPWFAPHEAHGIVLAVSADPDEDNSLLVSIRRLRDRPSDENIIPVGFAAEAWVFDESTDMIILDEAQLRGATETMVLWLWLSEWHDDISRAWLRRDSAAMRAIGERFFEAGEIIPKWILGLDETMAYVGVGSSEEGPFDQILIELGRQRLPNSAQIGEPFGPFDSVEHQIDRLNNEMEPKWITDGADLERALYLRRQELAPVILEGVIEDLESQISGDDE